MAVGITAAPITLAWDAASDPDVAGYVVYYGLASQSAVSRVNVGANLSCTINLIASLTYRIYAVSFNAAGVESIPSNELLYTPPGPVEPPAPRVELTQLADGSMRLSYLTTPGRVCGVQFAATPNPLFWQTLTNVTATSLGNVIAVDLSAKQVPQRFYRVALAPQPLLSAVTITRQADGNLLLRGTAPPGASCLVLYATQPNPTSWLTRATVLADAEGWITYLDTTATNVSSRFYRLAMPGRTPGRRAGATQSVAPAAPTGLDLPRGRNRFSTPAVAPLPNSNDSGAIGPGATFSRGPTIRSGTGLR